MRWLKSDALWGEDGQRQRLLERDAAADSNDGGVVLKVDDHAGGQLGRGQLPQRAGGR